MERFHLKKLKSDRSRQQYKTKIANRFAALVNLNNDDINMAEKKKKNITVSAKESLGLHKRKQHDTRTVL